MAVALDIEVRLLEPADAPQVADLIALAFAEEFEGSGAGPRSLVRQLHTGGWVQRRPLRRIAPLVGVEFAFFVAVLRGRVVGCTGVMGQQLPVINSVAVLPDFRRRGIAEALVLAAERYAAERGHDRVVLDVLAHNTPAHTLYLKMGYEEYHRYRAYATGPLSPRPSGSFAATRHGQGGDCHGWILSHDRSSPLLVGEGALPPGYHLTRPNQSAVDAFAAVERASLPEGFRLVTPTLRRRYVGGPPPLIERLVSGAQISRRVLLHEGEVAGYVTAHLAPGLREGRIEYPLLPSVHTPALPGALADALRFIHQSGGTAARVDTSGARADQHTTVEALGFTHRWTFVQMVKRLARGVRVPVPRG